MIDNWNPKPSYEIQKWEQYAKFQISNISWIPCTTRSDTQGCSVGLADAKLCPFNDITLFDTKTLRTKVSASQVQTSMTLLVTLASYILASLCSCSSHTLHVFTITTLSHLRIQETKKPFIISFIVLCFIQLKINKLFLKWRCRLCKEFCSMS